jgi:hypothetical protein
MVAFKLSLPGVIDVIWLFLGGGPLSKVILWSPLQEVLKQEYRGLKP